MAVKRTRILRDYRFFKCKKLNAFSQRVRKGMTNNPNIPDSLWVNHPGLLALFFAAADKLDIVYHESLLRSIVSIAARETLEVEVIAYLDQIASLLEAAAVQNSEMLLTSGFNLAKERRGRSRAPQPPVAMPLKVEVASQNVATEESAP
ncbi:hypothetical protein [Geomesophilobacter sediminis]|uniref:Uncharacterized protein n=1 Tax=Geomesophilobacter sediminis TaxID=2798584 RepID=A0A8J7M1B5_9BACT|nr:hypothetical protein [Geomesophilobacter sediminis]MBJ6726827.1 hypothetical protein [Geomesophilobacter sediminis]